MYTYIHLPIWTMNIIEKPKNLRESHTNINTKITFFVRLMNVSITCPSHNSPDAKTEKSLKKFIDAKKLQHYRKQSSIVFVKFLALDICNMPLINLSEQKKKNRFMTSVK